STLNQFGIVLYCLAIIAFSALLDEMILISALFILLATLLLFREQSRFRLLKSLDPSIVTLHDDSGGVELDHLGDHFRFDQIRIFTNRWFIILKMKNKQVRKNIILISDRFVTLNHFLRFRYQIINMSRNQHAT
ncbi:MAG: hypothetical protein ACYST9_05440, partial [Planctomycetota bacterium]